MKKRLKIVAPFIECYVADASVFSILVEKYQMQNILNDYIQLVFKLFKERPQYDSLMFLDTGYAWRGRGMDWKLYYHSELEKQHEDIIKFMEYTICHDYYLIMSLDEYYINTHFFYLSLHNMHDYLIYGFDDGKRKVYVCGYTTKRKFEKFEISYESFCASFHGMNVDSNSWNNQIQAIKCKKEVNDGLDISQINDNLKLYINAEKKSFPSYVNSSIEQSEQFVYGIDIYGVVQTKVERNIGEIDLRIFRIIWEHKKMFLLRLKALNELNKIVPEKIISQFKELERIANLCFMLGMKYNLTQAQEYIVSSLENIKRIEEQEMELIPVIITILDEYQG